MIIKTPRPLALPDPGAQPIDHSKANWLIVVACIIWILNPLDGDFIPVAGWLDDALACFIAYKQFRK